MRRIPACPVAILLPLLLSGCESPTVVPEGATTLLVEGTVAAGWYPTVGVPGALVLLEARMPDGTGVLASDSTDEAGRYAITLDVPVACAAGDSLPAILQVRADDFADYLWGSLGGGRFEPRLACDPEPQTLDATIHREVYRTPQAVAGGLTPLQLGVGREHACVVAEGGAWCWGRGGAPIGNVGDGWEPVRVLGGHAFTRVSASGLHHTCALDADSLAWCWGEGGTGALGPAVLERSAQPVLVSADLRFVDAVAGRWHSCGLTTGGDVFCWGLTRSLGAGIEGGVQDVHPQPARAVLDEAAVAISGSFSHTCALTAASELLCWGFSYAGELGAGESPGDHFSPMNVLDGHTWSTVDAGEVYTCALDTEGAAWCWGRNIYGRFGAGEPMGDVGHPVAVAGGHTFVAISAGPTHTCALTADGAAWCWGRNDYGQMGVARDAFDPEAPAPVAVDTDLRFTTIASGYRFTCGITTDEELVCWGWAERLGAGYAISG